MGQYFYLVCHETKSMMYVGKGPYLDGEQKMTALNAVNVALMRFLNAHMGKSLVVLPDTGGDPRMTDEVYEYEDWGEDDAELRE